MTAGRLLAAAVLASASAPALAQQATDLARPAHSLFDPVPGADLASLCTDRPTKSTAPCTVDAGHLQIEADLVNVSFDRSSGLDTSTWLITNPTIKLGLLPNLDGEVTWSPYDIVTAKDRATGAESRVEGIGDVYIRVKWSLTGSAGKLAVALVPYVKAPTAPLGIGDGAVEGGLIVPVNVNLPRGFSLIVDGEADDFENAAGDGRHLNTSALASLSKGLSKTLTVSAELWTDANFDPADRRTQSSADLGLAWIPAKAPNLQLDGGVNLGLNNHTPGVQAYVGVSRRF